MKELTMDDLSPKTKLDKLRCKFAVLRARIIIKIKSFLTR